MSASALEKIREHIQESQAARQRFFDEKSDQVVETARVMAVCLTRGGKILLCGNGGSAADCQHLAAEFVNRFLLDRPPLPAVALTTDSSILTAVGNDFGFDLVFKKQVQALGNPGDVLVGISTSGASTNVIHAMREARARDMITVGLTGGSGGEMVPLCDFNLMVQSKSTPAIQEVHIAIEHMLCHLVDHFLFEAVDELAPYLDGRGGPSETGAGGDVY